jgi:lysophospholipase L1-like esterase
MSPRDFYFIVLLVPWLAGCATVSAERPATSVPSTPTRSPTATSVQPSPTNTRTLTQTLTPSPTRKWPLTLVFYGDSLLKIGEVGREGNSGFSFVDDLRTELDPAHTIIMANYGGRRAKWGFENWEQDVLPYHPDIVTIWWGFNDLQGCGGFFDEDTNAVIQYKLQGRIDEDIRYLRMQIDALREKKIAAFILTVIPITGELPWTHFDENNRLIWEKDHWCDYNLGLKQLADAQRALVSSYSSKNVFLVDAWQVYMDHRAVDWMYADIMHPGPKGAELIAEAWYRVFSGMIAGQG